MEGRQCPCGITADDKWCMQNCSAERRALFPLNPLANPELFRCSACGIEQGGQHRPSCHRQGLVTEDSDYRDKKPPGSETVMLTGKCRICDCSELNPCVEGCFWAAPDLCSECAEFIFLTAEYFCRSTVTKDRFTLVFEEAMRLKDSPEFTEVDDAVPIVIQPSNRIVVCGAKIGDVQFPDIEL